jgi:predicted nuclease of predicted toxin-antitoxin system
MRVLLDEQLPRHLARELTGHQVRTVQQEGWAGLKNGELLRRAAEKFDVLVTADQNLQFQQNLAGARLGVVLLAARSTALEDLRPLVPATLNAIGRVRPGEMIRVAA